MLWSEFSKNSCGVGLDYFSCPSGYQDNVIVASLYTECCCEEAQFRVLATFVEKRLNSRTGEVSVLLAIPNFLMNILG